MNFVSAKIRLFRIYSIVFAITGAFVLNCALGQPVSSDEAKTATANPNIPGLNQLDDSSSKTSGSGTFNNRVDENAKKIVQDLNGAGSSAEAKEYIEKIFSSEASKNVKYQAQKISLRKLASLAEEEGRLEDAQQYLAVYVKRFPDDELIPVVLLNQGELYRKMGAYDLERQKCYDVIKAAQSVELDRDKYNLNYVKRAVLTAQINIAESFFDEAKKMPTKLAEMGFSNSVEQFQTLTKSVKQFQTLTNSVELLDQGSEFDGLELGELNNVDLSLKLIRALHELSISKRSKLSISKRGNKESIDADKQEVEKSFQEVHDEGDRFIKNYDAAVTEKKGEVLYYVLHAIRNSKFEPSEVDSSELLKEFEALYKLSSEKDMKTLPWILKGAGELGQYFFQKGKDEKGENEIKSYEKASLVFGMHVELIAGGKGESEKLLELLYGLQYAGTLIDEKIKQNSLYNDTFNDVRGIVDYVKSGAEKIGLKLPLLSNLGVIGMDVDGDGMDAYDELLIGHSDTNPDNVPSRSEVDEKVKLKGTGNDAGGKDANEEKLSVTSDTAPDVSDNEKLKNMVTQSIKYLKSQANIRYRHILPVLYNLGLCYENLSNIDEALTVFERIPAAVVKVNPLKGEFVDDAIFESPDTPLKFQVVKLLNNTLYPDAALVCHLGGEINKGVVVRSKDGRNEVEIEHFLSLDSLLTQKHVGDGSLSLRLIRDMAVWRVNNLSWLSEFEDGLNDVK
ncbi:MAG: tetratricopeptide repeat protein [Limisphaerales bacterium]